MCNCSLKEEEKETDKVFKEIMVKKFPYQIKNIKLRVQKLNELQVGQKQRDQTQINTSQTVESQK